MIHWYDEENDYISCKESNAYECFHFIWSVGFDYDGCETVEDLKGLIDDIVASAKDGMKFINDGKITDDDTYDEDARTLAKALLDRETARNRRRDNFETLA